MLVQHGLEQNRLDRPDQTALVCCGRRLSYQQVDAMANRLANALLDGGVRRGDRVAIHLPNGIEAVAGIYGALKAGAVFVVVNHTVKADKLAYILNDCGAKALIAGSSATAQGTLRSVLDRTPGVEMTVLTGDSFESIQEQYPDTRPAIDTIDLDLACLIYTSGSTGEPKAVMCDHASMVFVAGSVMSYLNNTAEDVILNVLPLSSGYGLYQPLMTFTFGGTLALESSFAYPAATMAKIAEERVTGFPGVPTVFATWLQMDLGTFDLTSLRYVTNAAAALPASHAILLQRRLPHVAIYSMYGLTETKRALYLPPEELTRRPSSCGKAIPGTEVWLEDEEGARLGPNQTGELVVRGRHVMRGYWGAPEMTARRFHPGPLPGERVCRTGDLFRMDEDGYLYFVGRMDDIVNTRGEKVAPKEVEAVLHEIPGVIEAVVFGVPDAMLGSALKAVVVADESRLRKADIFAHCKAQLQDFMVPKHIEFRAELPKTSSGKVLKRALQ
jgi:long-chain acyl-CoA synthetase